MKLQFECIMKTEIEIEWLDRKEGANKSNLIWMSGNWQAKMNEPTKET